MSRDTASDMHLFKEGRAPFLEFLRNLTPQALILSIAMLSGHNLQWSCCHVENTWETILSAVFFMIWVAAVWANSSLFVQRYLISVERIDRVSKRLGQRKVTGFRHLQMLLTYAWRYRRVVFFGIGVRGRGLGNRHDSSRDFWCHQLSGTGQGNQRLMSLPRLLAQGMHLADAAHCMRFADQVHMQRAFKGRSSNLQLAPGFRKNTDT